MVLSELQVLSTPDKLKYLCSPDGLTQLQQWLSSGLSLCNIAKMLQIRSRVLYKLCDSNPDIVALTGRLPVTKKDQSRDPAYRLMIGYTYNYHVRGTIINEFESIEEVWHSQFIHQYFSSFGRSELDYLDNYIKEITQSGICQLSNTYSILYCKISPSGIVKILKPTP